MNDLDAVVFGDNQFFGINHMSQEKAQQLAEQFHDTERIFEVYDLAIDAGIRAIMLNSNERAAEICDRFRARASGYPSINWYPSIPYPHKYANLITEKGLVPAVNSVLFGGGSALGGLGMLAQGGLALVSRDAVKMMKMLVEIEMRAFNGLQTSAVFLQNVVTDLILGLGMADLFHEYSEFIRRKFGATPGFITQNMPFLKSRLEAWGISGVVICTSINRIGYLMSPDIASYERALRSNDASAYQIMAMSTLASGAIAPAEAYAYINSLNIQSVVFGASSKKHIDESARLISGRRSVAG